MGSISLGLKEADKWVDHLLLLKRTKRVQSLLDPLSKANYLFVIGQPGQLMKQGVKMIQ